MCAICQSKDREAIDTALVSGKSVRAVAVAYGISKTRVHAYLQTCLSETIQKAAETYEAGPGGRLLDHMAKIQEITFSVVASAVASVDGPLVLSTVRESRANTETIAKLTGQIGTPRAPTVNAAIAVKVFYEDPRREGSR